MRLWASTLVAAAKTARHVCRLALSAFCIDFPSAPACFLFLFLFSSWSFFPFLLFFFLPSCLARLPLSVISAIAIAHPVPLSHDQLSNGLTHGPLSNPRATFVYFILYFYCIRSHSSYIRTGHLSSQPSRFNISTLLRHPDPVSEASSHRFTYSLVSRRFSSLVYIYRRVARALESPVHTRPPHPLRTHTHLQDGSQRGQPP